MKFYIKDGYRCLKISNYRSKDHLISPHELFALGFDRNEIIHTEVNDFDFTRIIKQRITKCSLRLQKFNWPYIPKHVKQKEILFRKF